MSFLSVQLRSGTKVLLQEFWVSKTYSGLLGGSPSLEINQMLHRAKRKAAANLWPGIPIVDVIDRSGTQGYLPANTFGGLLTTYENRTGNGSHLCVLWLQDTLAPLISDENIAVLAAIDWRNLAKPFTL